MQSTESNETQHGKCWSESLRANSELQSKFGWFGQREQKYNCAVMVPMWPGLNLHIMVRLQFGSYFYHVRLYLQL